MINVPGHGTAVPNATGRPGTSGIIPTMVEVEAEDTRTGVVGTTSKDSTPNKVRINSKVGTNHRAQGKVVTHLQVNIQIKVSTNRVHSKDRHHRTRIKTNELVIKDKVITKVMVAIISKGLKLDQLQRMNRGAILVVHQGATQTSTWKTHRHVDFQVVECVV